VSSLDQAQTNEFVALVTGALIGSIMRAAEFGLLLDLELATDDDGNYLPRFTVTGRESGHKVLVTIEPVE
jgi:hypothetical protein